MSKESIKRYFELMEIRPELFTDGELRIISDPSKIQQFEIASQCDMGIVYKSPYHFLLKDLVEDHHGERFAYERIVKVAKNAVVSVPIYNDQYVLINQFRHSLRNTQLAFPRGFGEIGLSAEDNVKKELGEELRCDVLKCSCLGNVVADSGLCGDKVSVYLCHITKPQLVDTEEILAVQLHSVESMQQMIKSGQIDDSFTISAFYLSLLYFPHCHTDSRFPPHVR